MQSIESISFRFFIVVTFRSVNGCSGSQGKRSLEGKIIISESLKHVNLSTQLLQLHGINDHIIETFSLCVLQKSYIFKQALNKTDIK